MELMSDVIMIMVMLGSHIVTGMQFLAFFASAVRRASRIRRVSNAHRSEQHCKQREKRSVPLIMYLSRVNFFLVF